MAFNTRLKLDPLNLRECNYRKINKIQHILLQLPPKIFVLWPFLLLLRIIIIHVHPLISLKSLNSINKIFIPNTKFSN